MLTPLSLDPTFSCFSSFQNFLTVVHDTSENYLLGYRGENQEKQQGWKLTALRVASFFTVVAPLMALTTWAITSLLIRTDETAMQFWYDKISVQQKHVMKKPMARMLARSRIKVTPYEKIFFMRYTPSGACRTFAADGHYPQKISEEKPRLLAGKKYLVVVVANSVKTVEGLEKLKKMFLANEDELTSPDYTIKVVALGLLDRGLGTMASSVPSNRLKEALIGNC